MEKFLLVRPKVNNENYPNIVGAQDNIGIILNEKEYLEKDGRLGYEIYQMTRISNQNTLSDKDLFIEILKTIESI